MPYLLAGFPGMDILLAVKNGVLLGKQRSPGAIHLKALETLTVCQRSPCLGPDYTVIIIFLNIIMTRNHKCIGDNTCIDLIYQRY